MNLILVYRKLVIDDLEYVDYQEKIKSLSRILSRFLVSLLIITTIIYRISKPYIHLFVCLSVDVFIFLSMHTMYSTARKLNKFQDSKIIHVRIRQSVTVHSIASTKKTPTSDRCSSIVNYLKCYTVMFIISIFSKLKSNGQIGLHLKKNIDDIQRSK